MKGVPSSLTALSSYNDTTSDIDDDDADDDDDDEEKFTVCFSVLEPFCLWAVPVSFDTSDVVVISTE